MKNMNIISVTDVEYIKDYIMCLEFSDGTKKMIDFFPILKGVMFEPLKDLYLFKQFGLTAWTIEWVNGVDFAPEYLYEQPEVAV